MKVYVSFDDEMDFDYFRLMKQWQQNHIIDCQFYSADVLDFADDVESQLEERISTSDVFVILIGETTRYLRNRVQHEMKVALALNKPIICANLNGRRFQDVKRCPLIFQDALAVHISFHAIILRKALLHWTEYHCFSCPTRKVGALLLR